MSRRVANLAGPAMLHGQPVKACPLCASPMAYTDQHIHCVTCLGVDHAVDSLINRSSCPVCAEFQLSRLYDRIDKARKGEKLRQNRTIVDPEVGTGPWAARGALSASTRAPERYGGAPTATFTPQGRPFSPAGVRRSGASWSNPFVNPEPPSGSDDDEGDLPPYQSSQADVHMLSPLHEPETTRRSRSPVSECSDGGRAPDPKRRRRPPPVSLSLFPLSPAPGPLLLQNKRLTQSW